jgi:cardiolipin synthase A/B
VPYHLLLILADVSIRLVLASRIIMSPEKRAVPAALAWLIVLAVPIPWLPVIAYLLVGESRLGRRRLARYRRITRDFSQRAQVFLTSLKSEWQPELTPYKPLAHVLTQVGDIPPLRGNTIDFVPEAEAFIDRLIVDIDAATNHVHLLFFIWMERNKGLELVQAVERAAQRGVTCRVLIDAIGSKPFIKKGLVDRLRRHKVQAQIALPVNPIRALFARVDLRNHRKIAIIDGTVAWTGSSNITDHTFGYKPVRRVGPWIDAMARVRGPAAQALEAVFLRDWITEVGGDTEAPKTDSVQSLAEAKPLESLLRMVPAEDEGSAVQVVPTGPDTGPATMRDALVTAIFAAKRELIMTTPYFVPDEATKEALVAAVMRGVDVKIVVPRHLDQLIVGAASRSHFAELLEAGVKIYLHNRGLLHSKTITIDSDVAMIGSHNLDERSFTLNFEVSLFIYDTDQASLLRMLQMQYLSESDPITASQWQSRPLWKRFAENCARLLGPLL